MIDHTTFGGNPAAVVLADRLNKLDDERLTRSVCKFLAWTMTGFSQLGAVDDDEWFQRLVLMWRRNQEAKIDFHPEVDSYIRNIIVTAYKEWLRGCRL